MLPMALAKMDAAPAMAAARQTRKPVTAFATTVGHNDSGGAVELAGAEGRLRIYLPRRGGRGAVGRPGAIAAAVRFGGRSFLHDYARAKVR